MSLERAMAWSVAIISLALLALFWSRLVYG